jgi:hypothetical protein
LLVKIKEELRKLGPLINLERISAELNRDSPAGLDS